MLNLAREMRVVNPTRRKLDKKIRKPTVKLGKLVKNAAKAKDAEDEYPSPNSMY